MRRALKRFLSGSVKNLAKVFGKLTIFKEELTY